jgi:hypothetical protein
MSLLLQERPSLVLVEDANGIIGLNVQTQRQFHQIRFARRLNVSLFVLQFVRGSTAGHERPGHNNFLAENRLVVRIESIVGNVDFDVARTLSVFDEIWWTTIVSLVANNANFENTYA